MKLLSIAFAAALASISATASAEEQRAAERYPPSSVRVKLIAGGLAVAGIAYGAGFVSASTWPTVPGASELKIPVVGPWLALAKNGCAPEDPDCGFSLYLRGILTALDGLVQLGGLGLVGEGIFMTTEASDARPQRSPPVTLRPAPVITASGAGFGVVGTF